MLNAGFCTETAGIWKFIGQVVGIFKIIIPVILVIIGVVAFGRAILEDDPKKIKEQLRAMIIKIVVAVIIFFIPAIISAIFGMISDFNSGDTADYTKCIKCVSSPGNC